MATRSHPESARIIREARQAAGWSLRRSLVSPSARSAIMSEAPGCPKQIIFLHSATSCTSDPPTSCAPIHKPDAPAGVSTSGGVAAGKRPSSLFRERAVFLL